MELHILTAFNWKVSPCCFLLKEIASRLSTCVLPLDVRTTPLFGRLGSHRHQLYCQCFCQTLTTGYFLLSIVIKATSIISIVAHPCLLLSDLIQKTFHEDVSTGHTTSLRCVLTSLSHGQKQMERIAARDSVWLHVCHHYGDGWPWLQHKLGVWPRQTHRLFLIHTQIWTEKHTHTQTHTHTQGRLRTRTCTHTHTHV
jgi:hypothetical protein